MCQAQRTRPRNTLLTLRRSYRAAADSIVNTVDGVSRKFYLKTHKGQLVDIRTVSHQIATQTPFDENLPLAIERLMLDPPSAGKVLIKMGAADLFLSDLSIITGNRPRPDDEDGFASVRTRSLSTHS